MKSVYKAVAAVFVLALLLIPAAAVVCSDGSDGAKTTYINETPQVTSSFDDRDNGTIKILIVNNDVAQNVVVKIRYYDEYKEGKDHVLAEKEVELAAEGTTEVSMSFGFSSQGEKTLTAIIYDKDGNVLFDDCNFTVSVGHSIWKNPITYVVIVLVVLVILVVVFIKVRGAGIGKKGKKSEPDQPTFTQLEEERQAKKIERKSKR